MMNPSIKGSEAHQLARDCFAYAHTKANWSTAQGGKTPVLAPQEARRLLDSIEPTTPAGLRDRTLMALMVYSFARIRGALACRVEDVLVQNRRLWVRLHETGGKRHETPCRHALEDYLAAYIERLRAGDRPQGPTVPHDWPR
jgi:integrase/recombinase XerC